MIAPSIPSKSNNEVSEFCFSVTRRSSLASAPMDCEWYLVLIYIGGRVSLASCKRADQLDRSTEQAQKTINISVQMPANYGCLDVELGSPHCLLPTCPDSTARFRMNAIQSRYGPLPYTAFSLPPTCAVTSPCTNLDELLRVGSKFDAHAREIPTAVIPNFKVLSHKKAAKHSGCAPFVSW